MATELLKSKIFPSATDTYTTEMGLVCTTGGILVALNEYFTNEDGTYAQSKQISFIGTAAKVLVYEKLDGNPGAIQANPGVSKYIACIRFLTTAVINGQSISTTPLIAGEHLLWHAGQ